MRDGGGKKRREEADEGGETAMRWGDGEERIYPLRSYITWLWAVDSGSVPVPLRERDTFMCKSMGRR